MVIIKDHLGGMLFETKKKHSSLYTHKDKHKNDNISPVVQDALYQVSFETLKLIVNIIQHDINRSMVS